VNLTSGDCIAWQRFSLNPLYKEWAEGKCGAKVHTDPCSCTFNATAVTFFNVQCDHSRITQLHMYHVGLPPSGGIPLPFMDLTGLTQLQLDTNGLKGSIPSAIGKLTGLVYLDLRDNQLTGSIPSTIGQLTALGSLGMGRTNHLTGSVPQEMLQLKQLTFLTLGRNLLTGKLPAFNFSQFTQCCTMDEDPFTCPLPAGAETCVGGPPPCSFDGRPRPAPTCTGP
jgi:hypothetical protein